MMLSTLAVVFFSASTGLSVAGLFLGARASSSGSVSLRIPSDQRSLQVQASPPSISTSPDELRRIIASEVDRVGSFQGRIGEQLQSLIATTRDLQASTRQVDQSRLSPVPESDSAVRELSHSLGTPLARIRAEALLLAHDPPNADGWEDHVRRIDVAVDLCQAFLFAFRRLGTSTEAGTVFSSATLGQGLVALAELFSRPDEPPVMIQATDVPDQLPGYSKSFTLAVLAPLVENAAEALPPYAEIEVRYVATEQSYRLVVVNESATVPEGPHVLEAGFTTKSSHQGLGLPAVRRLIDSVQGEMIYDVHGMIVSVTVDFPKIDEAT